MYTYYRYMYMCIYINNVYRYVCTYVLMYTDRHLCLYVCYTYINMSHEAIYRLSQKLKCTKQCEKLTYNAHYICSDHKAFNNYTKADHLSLVDVCNEPKNVTHYIQSSGFYLYLFQSQNPEHSAYQ